MRDSLDRYITGNYGEDYFRECGESEDVKMNNALSLFNSPGELMSRKLPVLVEGGLADPIPGFEGWQEKSNLGLVATWENIGEFFVGIYLGVKLDIGPNNSRMYTFLSGDGLEFQVWGSTILDGKMDAMKPIPGCEMMIMYCGTVPTKRGQSDAKDFRVLVNPVQPGNKK
jgi:hypothetical protein